MAAKSHVSKEQKEYLKSLGFTETAIPEAKAKKRSQATSWPELEAEMNRCQACRLAKTRNKVVIGSGSKSARIMFVGEGPGAEEDAQGVPFVGRSGQLLTKMVEAMGLSREKDIYIANVVKCRPPENRNPHVDEIDACASFLDRQIALLDPEFIVCWGTFAAQRVLESEEPIGQLRGKLIPSTRWKRKNGKPVQVMATYHPAFCLRNPNMKKPVWDDLQIVMKELGLKG